MLPPQLSVLTVGHRAAAQPELWPRSNVGGGVDTITVLMAGYEACRYVCVIYVQGHLQQEVL